MRSRAALIAIPMLLSAPELTSGAPFFSQAAAPPVETPTAGVSDPIESFGEEISVEVVGLQVWVTDRKGQPVTGLDRDDFLLFQDGEPVEIVNFAVYDGPAAEEAPSTSGEGQDRELQPMDLGAPDSDPLHVAILVDHWNMRPEDRARVFEDLRSFLGEHVRPADRVALLVHDRSLQLVQGFTDDHRTLNEALDRIERISPSATTLPSERRQAIGIIAETYEFYASEIACTLSAGWGTMENAARHYATAVQAHARQSAAALASAANVLSGLPGHRLLLYVGSGMPQTPGLEVFELLADVCPTRMSELGFFETDYDLTWLYEEVAARANAAGVTLYTIETDNPAMDLGLDQRFSPAPRTTGSTGTLPSFRVSVPAQRQRALDAEASLELLARATGGRALLNVSDFEDEFERLARDLRSYYSLGFRPPEPGDGELHRLEVRLQADRPFRVRHRRAYRNKPPEQRMAERVLGVAQFGGGANPLEVRLEVGEAVPVDGAYRVPVRLWVPLSKLTLVPGDEEGTLLGRLQVLMTATEKEGELGPVRQKLVAVTLEAGEEGVVTGDQLVEIEVDLGPGQHHVAVAVRDGLGGETSYVGQGFRVPGAAVAASSGPGD